MQVSPSGSFNSKIVLVGEAPGKQEELLGKPFVGASGQELTRILRDAGISREVDCFLTNVFTDRPSGNKIAEFCGSKKTVGKEYSLPPLSPGKYVFPEHLHELERLKKEIEGIRPNIIVALGATACWALCQQSKVGTIRGTTLESTLVPGIKVLPTYHPAAVLRNWTYRAIVVADLLKAKRESAFPEILRLNRKIWIEPTIEDLYKFEHKYITLARPDHIAFDIETEQGQISCIGIATSKFVALVLPLIDYRNPSRSYWPTPHQEAAAMFWIKKVLEDPSTKKSAQNGLYDVQWLLKQWGITPRNFTIDTMLLHHSLQPEMQKSLGFLGSIYTSEASWKPMRKSTNKKDE